MKSLCVITPSAIGPQYFREAAEVIELNYLAKIRPDFSMVPDFQYIWNPGRHVENPNTPGQAENNAAVVGVRAKISY